jgi:hypothetical protein
MNAAAENNIITHLFRQPSLEQVPLEAVQEMAAQHPSFAVAQFLLLKKMRDIQHVDFSRQLHKTALYFNNPLWLEFLLNDRSEAGVAKDTVVAENVTPSKTDEEKLTAEAIVETNTEKHLQPETETDTHTILPAVEEAAGQHNETMTTTPSLASAPLADELKKLAAEIQSAKEKAFPEKDEQANLPAFEPYHTIDYFASQGIKLEKIDQNPQDKFGRQLKSFTEWIKSMKRLPQADLQKRLEQSDDSKVIADAAVSLEEKDVVTEAMAAVYEKQGLFEKAMAIYHKLSLLNPDKSHYFAAKSDALKQ